MKWEWKLFGNPSAIIERLPVTLTVGNFDGVHRGHVYLLNSLKEFADGLPTAVVTFDPHPVQILGGLEEPYLLCSLEERVERILSTGIDVVVVQRFSKEFAQLSPEEFCSAYLNASFRIQKLLLGFNFRFGVSASGDVSIAEREGKRLGWQVKKADPFLMGDKTVSSSSVRRLLQAGDIQAANSILGRFFGIQAVVVPGEQRGRLLGYPTVNLALESPVFLPKIGVYAGYIEFAGEGRRFRSVLSLGFRPTFGEGLTLRAEAHILDFSQDVYGKHARFFFHSFLRDEARFSSSEALAKQISLDVERARSLL